MKIPFRDILEEVTDLAFPEPVDELNSMLKRGETRDYQFEVPLDVTVGFYRAERDLFFDGRVGGEATGTCARCLEPFVLPVAKDFSVILSPEPKLGREVELAPGDLTLSFYSSGEDVDLTRIVYEQIMLALPIRPLCGEQCQGLCSQCGANRNIKECSCTEETSDPRLAVLRGLKIDRGA